MTKQDLLRVCRYYKGEKENPYTDTDQDKALFWDYERKWIDFKLDDSDTLCDYIGDYVGVGLGGFEKMDDTPLSLKALLFNRYAKTSYSIMSAVEPFKEFYKKYYMA